MKEIKKEQLLFFLEHYSTEKGDEFDPVGIVYLFKACLENLMKNKISLDKRALSDHLTQDNLIYLNNILNRIKNDNVN